MNERIRELYEQANIRFVNDYHLSGKPREAWRSISDIFAELIVRECAKFCDDKNSKLLGTMMKSHFGVEE